MFAQPYLFFDGRTEEALAFYKKAIGAKVEMLMRFKDNPDNPPPDRVPPNSAQKVMHTSFRVGDTQVMASDGDCKGEPSFKGFALTLNAANGPQAEKLFKALSQGGQVVMPLAKTFFSPRFGMLSDRFGVMWMVIVPPKDAKPAKPAKKAKPKRKRA
jgi:PhnB protein